jgi:peptidyl-prolyl cis-trans isomerase D
MGMTADQYAQALRNQLTTQQLINAVVGTDFMLKGETDELAALVSQQRVVREATIDVNALAAKQQVSDEDVNAYYEQNKNPLLLQSSSASATSSWMRLHAGNASDAEIQSYYDQHQDQFTQPQRNRYSVIQTKTEADAKAVLDELNKGADFATWRKQNPPTLSLPKTAVIWAGWKTPQRRTEKCRSERERPAVWRY